MYGRNIADNIEFVGIRAHDVKTTDCREKMNTFEIENQTIMETPFEYQILVNIKTCQCKKNDIWIKSSKSRMLETKRYVNLPPENLMLLR